MFKKARVVELSHHLLPGKEEYHLLVDNRFVEELLPEYTRPKDTWYIMSEVSLWSHVGTHIESPFHYLKNGQDVSAIPIKRVVGECVLLDFTDKKVGDSIDENDLQARGKEIQSGIIVFIKTGLDGNYRTPFSHDRPFFTLDAIRWLVDKEIACLGVDCSGIEKRNEPTQPDHELLFSHGIPLIEHLTNLDALHSRRFFVVAVPWRVVGLEACPVSVVAIEDEELA